MISIINDGSNELSNLRIIETALPFCRLSLSFHLNSVSIFIYCCGRIFFVFAVILIYWFSKLVIRFRFRFLSVFHIAGIDFR